MVKANDIKRYVKIRFQ